jgi:cytochrome bd ubiquinol oxidase subunit I
MLALAWGGTFLILSNRLERQRWFLWATFCSFPLGFIATLTGWFTAEVGRQPWAVFGQLRTADATTPFLTTPQVAASLVIFAAVYALIFLFGTLYIYRLLRLGPTVLPMLADAATNPKRPLSVPGRSPGVAAHGHALEAGE